jgi:hypothetical protein
MAQEWFCRHAGGEAGPMAASDLKGLAESGRLGPHDEVRKADMDTWVQARFVRGLFPETPADTTGKMILAAEALLRTKDYKRAEATFSQALDIEPKCVRAWAGKAKAIGFQTSASTPTGLIINLVFEDCSEAALLCLVEARKSCVSKEDHSVVDESKSEIGRFTIKVFFEAASLIYKSVAANRQAGPAYAIQVSFVGGKAVPMLRRCRELDPENQSILKLLAEALEFCGDTKSSSELIASFAVGNGILLITRSTTPHAATVDLKVVVDGQLVGAIPNGGELECSLPSGQHKVEVQCGYRFLGLKNSATVLIASKQTTRYRTYIDSSLGLVNTLHFDPA